MKRMGTALSLVIIGLGLTFVLKPDPTSMIGHTGPATPPTGSVESPSTETNQPNNINVTVTPVASSPSHPLTETSRRININRASAAELETLPGIGPTTARAIVEHRDKHGLFARPEDLLIVDGIGEKTYRALAALISVE